MKEKTCIIVCGPTAVGKTSYGVQLASQYKTDIISADSRQCFKELNIGVARPSPAELQSVKHHFIASHSVHNEVNVKVFEEYALNVVNEIFKKNDVAIMVGGTGLYIKAFAEGIDDVPVVDENIRREINKNYAIKGISWLTGEIMNIDSHFFEKGEIKNPQRMMRALEVKLSTGKSILDFHSGKKRKRNFSVQYVLMKLPREQLYQRIDNRVDQMMEDGLLHEAENLFPLRHLNALQTVGYKELFDYFEEKITIDKAIEEIKKNTRHYAKRQITWFRKYLPEKEVKNLSNEP